MLRNIEIVTCPEIFDNFECEGFERLFFVSDYYIEGFVRVNSCRLKSSGPSGMGLYALLSEYGREGPAVAVLRDGQFRTETGARRGFQTRHIERNESEKRTIKR